MRHSLSRFLVCAIVLVSAACEGGPRQISEPSAVPTLNQSAGEYVLVEGRIPDHIADFDASQLIGPEGGALHLAGHRIEVPAGAVSDLTLFTITVVTNGYVEVELTAVLSGLLGVLDVGESGFGDKTVKLTLTYAWAESVSDPSKLVILRMHEDGTAEALPTTLNATGKTVSAELDHFSRYAMASN